MLPFNDISKYQGAYNMATDSNIMVMMKAGGGDDGFYIDSEFDTNYSDAIANGKIPFIYYVAGNSAPAAEANYFAELVQPLAIGDGYALDLEPTNTWTPSQVWDFVTQFSNVTGTWPWVYMDISRCNSADWSQVFNKCGLWIGAPSYAWTDNIPVKYTVIAQQGPIVSGHDTDMYFGSIESLRSYTYGRDIQPTTTTTITTTTTTTTLPPTTTTTTHSTSTSSTTLTTTTTTLPPQPKPKPSPNPKPSPPTKLSWWQRILRWFHL